MIYNIDENYFVRPLNEGDLEGPYVSWFQDQAVSQFNSHGKFFKTKNWFKEYVNSLDSEDKVVWAICDKNSGHIGNISLSNISFVNRNAELTIIIGNKDHWGKSIGFKSSKLIIKHGFNKLNLSRVYLGVASKNQGMINLALKLGMKQEGSRRNHLYLEGAWCDMLEFGLLKDEFNFI